jgi:hypothetical protein
MFKTMNWSSVFHMFKIRGGEPPGQYFLKENKHVKILVYNLVLY